MIGRTTDVCVYGGIAPRGRDVAERKIGDIWKYSFPYVFEGKPFHVVFQREYQLAPNLIDAVIDNHQIKTHGTSIIPDREGVRCG